MASKPDDLTPDKFLDELEGILAQPPSLQTSENILELLQTNSDWIEDNRHTTRELLHERNIAASIYNFIDFLRHNTQDDRLDMVRLHMYAMLSHFSPSKNLAKQITEARVPEILSMDLANLQEVYRKPEQKV